jgi:hypothetical protein
MPYVENMLTAGCMFITNAWIEYTRNHEALERQDKVFVLADEHRMLESHMLRGATTTPLFKHGGASSWHSWDAAVIVFIGAYWTQILVVAGLSVPVLCSVMILYALRKSAGRAQWRWIGGRDQEEAAEEKSHSH